MNNVEKSKFLGMLYDVLINDGIIKYEDKPKDLREKNKRLEKYLDKLNRVRDKAFNEYSSDIEYDTERYLSRIKELYYNRYIIKESNIPDKYFEGIEQHYLEQGHGHINLVNPKTSEEERLRKGHIESVIRDQKDSLDNWLNYFLSDDSSYLEIWAKVWAFQGMLSIGNLNVGKDGYERRSKTSANPFVPLDAEILGRCVDLVKETFDKMELTDEETKKLVSNGSFSKLYGKLLANKKQIKAETTEGVWIKYNKETEESIEEKLKNGQEPEYIKLYNSLQEYNTGWCTAGSRYTAKSQMLGGDFYVYYSKDKEGRFAIPRLAIRMDDLSIGEIRGVDENQNIELVMEEILEEKLKEFPDRDVYNKKVFDMKYLTIIYNKNSNGEELSKEELAFLYEVYNNIEGFGYDRDPRIKEIINKRNKVNDLNCLFQDAEFNRAEMLKEGLLDSDKRKKQISDMIILTTIYNKYLRSIELNNEDLIFLYELYDKISELNFGRDPRIEEIITKRNIRSDLARTFGCVEDDIGFSKEELTQGKRLKYYYGDLLLGDNLEEIVLPEVLFGNLKINFLDSVYGVLFPNKIYGNLRFRKVKNINGAKFPDEVTGGVFFGGLNEIRDVAFPKKVGKLSLISVTSAINVVFPEEINSGLDLKNLVVCENVIFPKIVKGDFNLGYLESASNMTLPTVVEGDFDLYSLEKADNLVLPEVIKGKLDLYYLNSLIGVTLPSFVGGEICFDGQSYTLEQLIEIQRQEEKALKNNKPKGLSRVRQEGFISNTIIILNIILFGVLCFILTLLIIK